MISPAPWLVIVSPVAVMFPSSASVSRPVPTPIFTLLEPVRLTVPTLLRLPLRAKLAAVTSILPELAVATVLPAVTEKMPAPLLSLSALIVSVPAVAVRSSVIPTPLPPSRLNAPLAKSPLAPPAPFLSVIPPAVAVSVRVPVKTIPSLASAVSLKSPSRTKAPVVAVMS